MIITMGDCSGPVCTVACGLACLTGCLMTLGAGTALSSITGASAGAATSLFRAGSGGGFDPSY